MRSSALKKQEYFEETFQSSAPSWEVRRRAIALETEAACRLPGNMNCPDFEDFVFSDFA